MTIPASTPPTACRLEMLPGESVRDQLLAAARIGFTGVTLPGRLRSAWNEAIRNMRSDIPVAFAGISLGFQGTLVDPEKSARTACRRSLLELFDLAAELNAGWINMPPCLKCDHPGLSLATVDGTSDSLDSRLVEQLEMLVDAVRERGLLLLIEPVNRFESDYLNSVVHAARLCARVNHPAVGCTADFFHMQIEELKIEQSVRLAAPWIRHVHVAENTRVEPGPGSLQLKPGFAALKSAGYAGWLEIECRRLTGPADEVLPKSADYIRQQWIDA